MQDLSKQLHGKKVNNVKKKSFRKVFAEAQKRESYWVAETILDFTENIYRLMEQKKISKADLAKALQVSPAYVTKILKGNVNFTLETMVRLARAVGGRLHTHVAPEDTQIDSTTGPTKEFHIPSTVVSYPMKDSIKRSNHQRAKAF